MSQSCLTGWSGRILTHTHTPPPGWAGLVFGEEEEGSCLGAASVSEEPREWLWYDPGAVTSFAGVDGIPRHEGSRTGWCIPWEIGPRFSFPRGKNREKYKKTGKIGKKGGKMLKNGKHGKKMVKRGTKREKGIPLFLMGLWLQNSERGFVPSPPHSPATRPRPKHPRAEARKKSTALGPSLLMG